MRYLLTGATGFVGGALAAQLVAAGHEVDAVVRSPARAGHLADLGVRLHEGDVTRKESMRAPMAGVDGVFHVAGWYKTGVRDRATAEAVNVNGTRNVLELLGELGIPRGVYTSTIAVHSDTQGRLVDEAYEFHGRHVSIYDETKARAHAVATDFIRQGLPLVIVQPGVVYGPGDTSGIRTTLVHYLQRKLPVIPTRTTFSWGYIDDTARGHLLAMERGTVGRNYFLTGPAHPLTEAIDLAEQITGIPGPRIRLDPRWLKAGAALLSLVERVVPLDGQYTAEGLRVAASSYTGDNRRAREELGWTVRSLKEGLALTLRHELEILRRV